MSLRCQWFGFPQAFLGTSQSMFNFPNWLCEKIYFLVFVLLTIFVLNFAQNKEEMLIFLFIYFFKKEVFTKRKIYCWGSTLEGQFGFGKASKVETHSTWHSGFLLSPFCDSLPWIESSCWTVSTQSWVFCIKLFLFCCLPLYIHPSNVTEHILGVFLFPSLRFRIQGLLPSRKCLPIPKLKCHHFVYVLLHH